MDRVIFRFGPYALRLARNDCPHLRRQEPRGGVLSSVLGRNYGRGGLGNDRWGEPVQHETLQPHRVRDSGNKSFSWDEIYWPRGSAFATGFIFGLGFDTATQISALTVSAIASATQGLQVALLLAGFFALGMIPTDTLDSLILTGVFAKISSTRGFRTISYGLSIVALSVAFAESYSTISGIDLLPAWAGAALAISILVGGFSYALRHRSSSERGFKRDFAETEKSEF